jgi:ribose transport system permease protein
MRLSLNSTGARVTGAILIAVLLFVLGSLLIPGYSSAFSIRAMLVLACLLAVACVGQTLTIIIGGIDLSIPFVIGFANVVAAQLYGDGINFVLV